MSFFGIINSYTIRVCLSLALTDMVPTKPKVVNTTECPGWDLGEFNISVNIWGDTFEKAINLYF